MKKKLSWKLELSESKLVILRVFPSGSAVKNPPTNAGDAGSVPEPGKIPWRKEWQPLQYSCLENFMDREA